MNAATLAFDDRCYTSASLDDISVQLIREHLQDARSDLFRELPGLPVEVLARHMNIVGGPSEALLPKNVGLLFFNDRPHEFFPATQIEVVWFPDAASGDCFEEKTFRGPLATILRHAVRYIDHSYLTQAVVKHAHKPEADRFSNFPIAAIKEALGNAIYHRSYEERKPVKVRITPEEVLILSYPGPDRSIRMEELQRGRVVKPHYRNRRIGEFLKELDLSEGRSTGLPKILRAMRNNGSPAPSFETDEDRNWFRVRLPVHPSFAANADVAGDEQETEQDKRLENKEKSSITHQDTPQDTPQVDERVQRLIEVAERRASRGELQAALKLRDRGSFTQAYLKPALEAGLIEMTVPDKPTSKCQRYRRTPSGEALARKIGDSRT